MSTISNLFKRIDLKRTKTRSTTTPRNSKIRAGVKKLGLPIALGYACCIPRKGTLSGHTTATLIGLSVSKLNKRILSFYITISNTPIKAPMFIGKLYFGTANIRVQTGDLRVNHLGVDSFIDICTIVARILVIKYIYYEGIHNRDKILFGIDRPLITSSNISAVVNRGSITPTRHIANALNN